MGAVTGLGGTPAGGIASGIAGGFVNPYAAVPAALVGAKGDAGPMLGGMIGGAGGVYGTGLPGPQQANIQQGVNPAQVQQAYQGSQNALAQQQALLNALNQQNGVGRQVSAYDQSQQLANALGQANALGKQNQAYSGLQGITAQQQALANQYQNIANGSGPNPAQAMLNQATGANVANQAALMAGQRGAGANVGLMARQAAQQGAALQQNAAGQAATMQANQQLAALQGVGAQQQAMAGTTQAAAGIGNQQLAAQQAQQAGLAQQAGTMVGQQAGATSTLNQAQQANQQAMLGGLNAQNQAAVGAQNSVNAANAGLGQTAMQGQQGFVGGLMNGAGAAAGVFAANGGMIGMADGGTMTPNEPIIGPQSSFGKFMQAWQKPEAETNSNLLWTPSINNSGTQAMTKGGSKMGQGVGKLVQTLAAAKGGLAMGGGSVAPKSSGQKAVKPGNSYDNDKIPAMLSEGEIVIPRSITQSGDPVRSAAQFVAQVMAKRRAK